jgi:enoyl-[acyl-carrier protein] reductase/trans-2-enoyl-CoA reductase (NAD+)
VEHTVQVMGGEDWEMWTDRLLKEGLLAPGAKVLAYSYIGPDVTQPVYRNGTIGAAKDHLEATAHRLNEKLKPLGGSAHVSVNKALVTQASSAIPFMPLYISILYKVMKEKGIHEGCIEQMDRLFRDRLYKGGEIPTDEKGRIRVDDWEMREDVQAEVKRLWPLVKTENLSEWADGTGYRDDFLRLFGFGIAGVDYGADVPEDRI